MLVLRGNNTVTGKLVNEADGVVRLEGYGTEQFGETIQITDGVSNFGEIEFTASRANWTPSISLDVGTESLVNETTGTFNVTRGQNGSRTILGTFENLGTTTLVDTGLIFSGSGKQLHNTGTLNIAGGGLSLTADTEFRNDGTTDIAAGQELAITEGTLTPASGSVTGDGTTRLTASNLGPGTLSGGGTILVSDTSLTLDPNFKNASVLVLRSNNTVTGKLVNEADGVVRLEGYGTEQFGETIHVSDGISNFGEIEFTASRANWTPNISLDVGTASLVNEATGTFNVTRGQNGSRTILGTFENLGTTTLVDTGLIFSGSGKQLHNTGALNIAGGGLSLTTGTSFLNDGTTDIAAGQELAITEGTLTPASGSVTGDGVTRLTASTLGPGTFSGGGTILVYDTTLTLDPNFKNASVLVLRGNNTVTGKLVNEAGGIVRLEGYGTSGTGETILITDGVSNFGEIEFTASRYNYQPNITLDVGAASLVNEATGTFNVTIDRGGFENLRWIIREPRHDDVGRHRADHSIGEPSFFNAGTTDIGAGLELTLTNATLNGSGAVTGDGTVR